MVMYGVVSFISLILAYCAAKAFLNYRNAKPSPASIEAFAYDNAVGVKEEEVHQ